MADITELQETMITLTADIVAAHVSNNSVAVNDLPTLISNVHGALSALTGPVAPEPAPKQEPAVSIRSSIKPDFIVCLEDGKKLKMLKRHLMTHYSMTPRSVPGEMGPCRRLSDGRAELCRTAPCAGQGNRPRYQGRSSQDARHQVMHFAAARPFG